MRACHGLLGCIATISAIGCGREVPQATHVVAPSERAAPAQPPAPPLEPVAAPANLVLLGRIQSLTRLTDALAERGLMPAEWRTQLAAFLPLTQGLVLPVDVAGVLTNPDAGWDELQAHFVVSVGLPSTDIGIATAKALGRPVQPAGPGTWRFPWTDNEAQCDIAPSLGPTSARVVCGEASALEALAGYATRGLARERSTDADVRVEVRAAPLHRLVAAQTAELENFATPHDDDDDLARTLRNLLREVISTFEGVHHVALEARLLPDGLETAISATFQSGTPWLVETSAEMSRSLPEIPEMFWRLPQDAAQATYAGEIGAARLEAVRSAAGDLIVEALKGAGASPGLVLQLRHLVAWTLSGLPVSATAQGFVTPDPKPASARAERIRQKFGWTIWGMNSTADDYKAYFDALTHFIDDPELATLAGLPADPTSSQLRDASAGAAPLRDLAGGIGRCVQAGPTELGGCLRSIVKSRGGGGPGRGATPAQRVRRSVEGFAPGAVTYKVTVPESWLEALDDGDPGTESSHAAPERSHAAPVSLVLMIVPEDSLEVNRTWIGLSTDERVLRDKLLAILGDRQTLGQRADMAALRARGQPKRVLVGGFTTWKALTRPARILPSLGTEDLTPLPVEVDMQAWPAAPTLRFGISVPDAVARDLVRIAAQSMQSNSDGGI